MRLPLFAACLAVLPSLFAGLFPPPAAAVETEALERLGFRMQSFKTLGINQLWNMEETKAHFAAAGVREKSSHHWLEDSNDTTWREMHEVMYLSSYIESEKPHIAQVLAEDNAGFRGMFRAAELSKLPTDCLYFENGLDAQGDVIQTVAVCFAYYYKMDPQYMRPDLKVKAPGRQFLVAVTLRKNQVELRTVKSYFRYLYGEPQEGTDNTWLVRPWYYAGLLTKNYVFLADPQENKSVAGSLMTDVSAVAIYVNMNGLAQVYTEIFEDAEKMRKREQERARQ